VDWEVAEGEEEGFFGPYRRRRDGGKKKEGTAKRPASSKHKGKGRPQFNQMMM